MRSLFMGRKKVCTQPVDYYLLAEDTMDLFENYGVSICCENGESATVRGITCSQDRIVRLLGLLMEYTVTPVALQDVIDDWILS